MIQIDAAMAAIFITVLLSLIAMGVAWGTISEKVKHNRNDIDITHRENKADHLLLFQKLQDVEKAIRNGGK
uniref:Uncharacterized protein n=1 Tax=viral metagenome TaxID=1070528 RepID=A0A6M3K2E1_9ZZZZ